MNIYKHTCKKRGNFESAPRQVGGAANGVRQACSPSWGETNNNYMFISFLSTEK